jgi:hypothetical protein
MAGKAEYEETSDQITALKKQMMDGMLSLKSMADLESQLKNKASSK